MSEEVGGDVCGRGESISFLLGCHGWMGVGVGSVLTCMAFG